MVKELGGGNQTHAEPPFKQHDTPRDGGTRRDAIRLMGGGAASAVLGTLLPAGEAAAQMAQGHRDVRPGTPPLQGVRVIERSVLLSGRLAGLLFADQGAEVFVDRPAGADSRLAGC
jgi:hypothetical protein